MNNGCFSHTYFYIDEENNKRGYIVTDSLNRIVKYIPYTNGMYIGNKEYLKFLYKKGKEEKEQKEEEEYDKTLWNSISDYLKSIP
jgi:hypothetical protein